MRGRTRLMAVAGMSAIAVIAAACGGGDGGGDTAGGGTDEPGKQGGEIVIRGCTPENPLVPGNTSETCGGDQVDAMTAKLVEYDTETAEPIMDLAESIETEDNQNFTVTLQQGRLFHDGTEVKAHNFVDAWNYTTAAKNGQAGSYFFGAIEGAAEISAEGAEGEEMSGLEVVDDYTFTIRTTEKVSNLPVRLGYSAFAPLPDAFFDDPEAFEENPIGAGPFKFVSKSTSEFVYEKFADYDGPSPAHVDKLTFRVYTDPKTAYTDTVAGNLDYTNEIPQEYLIGEAYKADLSDRALVKPTGRFAGIVFSPNDPQLKENLQLRQALSKAIDREQIAETIFNGTVTPAHGWAPDVVDGATDEACGEYCDFDPEGAKALYEESGGYDGTLTLTVNADGAHTEWATAVCNSIQNTLELECLMQTTPDFATFNKQIDAGEIQGMFRTGWQADYPSIENFLAPIYGTGADSNWSQYNNPDFDQKLTEAASAEGDDANALYQEAEAMLGEDLPTTPLWYPSTVVGWSDNVENVNINVFGVLDFSAISVK
ncbi:MAG: ABC transporter substrate-binding protein [Propionibacterium sp.]|nr:ABC transporter substrate-binding protein [Propionibacterium sp.]